jgi:hypothetical protein
MSAQVLSFLQMIMIALFNLSFHISGDVYSDWTALPGDKKLQAHLNVLYEAQHYVQYLDIIENVLVTHWRELRFGTQDFAIGELHTMIDELFVLFCSYY